MEIDTKWLIMLMVVVVFTVVRIGFNGFRGADGFMGVSLFHGVLMVGVINAAVYLLY